MMVAFDSPTSGEQSAPMAPKALSFAEVIAGYHEFVWLHSGDNRYETKVPWPVTPPDGAWIVRVTDWAERFRTLAFDFDVSKGDARRDAERFCRVLTDLRIEHVMSCSGPSEGRHVLVTVTGRMPAQIVREIAEVVKMEFPSLDMGPLTSGTGSSIRPPYAPHRDGGRSEPRGDPREALETLRRGNEPRSVLALLERAGRDTWRHRMTLATVPPRSVIEKQVSQATLALLRTAKRVSKTPTDDGSPSGVIWSALLGLLNANFSPEQAARILQHSDYEIANVVVDHARRKRQGTLAYLHGECQRAQRWLCDHPAFFGPNDARLTLNEVSDAASKVAWKGTKRQTDRVVLEALIEIGLRIGRLEFAASQREIAELAKLSRRTIPASLCRLAEAGWITKSGARHGRIMSFGLHVPRRSPISTSQGGRELNGELSGIVLRLTNHDAFRRGALPRSAAFVLAALNPFDWKRPTQIHDATGQPLSTIYRTLKKLCEVDLVTNDGAGGWVRDEFPERKLDAIAERLGTANATARQHERHLLERFDHRQRFGSTEQIVDLATGEFRTRKTLGSWPGRRPPGLRKPNEDSAQVAQFRHAVELSAVDRRGEDDDCDAPVERDLA